MTAERWSRMYQILTTIEIMNNKHNPTTIRDLKDYLKKNEPKIEINIVNSSIRHYRKIGLVKRKHKPYLRPFEYSLSKKGEEQLSWLENEEYLEFID